MNNRRSKRIRRSAAAVALAVTGIFAGQKAYQYSADPSGEKDCPPIASDAAMLAPGDTARQTRGALGSAPVPAAGQAQLRRSSFPGFQPRAEETKPVRGPASAEASFLQPGASAPAWAQRGGTINDASCLNRTPIYGVVAVRTADDVKNALAFAKANGRKVSIAGVRHSMGGQAFARDAVVLDMRSYNKMSLDEANKVLTVESGATWHDIQNFLHPKYAVKAMQSTDIFTVGGSIAVNAHGMDHRVGAVGSTIRAMRVMLPDGTIQQLSRTENPELFNLVIGGYGLFGVILDVQLDVTDNAIYDYQHRVVDYTEFPGVWETELVGDPTLGLFYGHLSTSPGSLLREMILYTYRTAEVADAEIPPLGEVANIKLRRFLLNFAKRGDLPMRLKWFMEKDVEPLFTSCTINRNQAMTDGEACLVSRNEPMHDSVKYLNNTIRTETDILHEYFIPREQFVPFVDGLREIITRNDATLLNASLRVVHREENFLSYAPADMFSVVLYINQQTTREDDARMARVTAELIDLTSSLGGRFFLPYQLHYTPEQLRQAYPQIGEFFAAKRRYDPDGLLSSTWYERYAPAIE